MAALTQLPSAATHSSLDLFQKNPVLVNFDHGNVQEVHPVTGVDGPTLEFEIRTDRNSFLDMSEVYLRLAVTIIDLNTLKPVDTTTQPVVLTNNALHSLFSNCEVSINGENVSTSNSLYAHKSFLTTEWSHSAECKNSILHCQGYSYEADPGNLHDVFTDRKTLSQDKKNPSTYYLFGKLAVDVFNCDKLLVPKSLVRIKLVKNSPSFALNWCGTSFTVNTGDTSTSPITPGNFSLKFNKASLATKQMIVNENVYSSLEKALIRSPARYTFTEGEAKTFIVPAGQSTFVRENIFNNRPIRSLAIAMNTNESFTGKLIKNPFHYQSFGLERLVLYRNGTVLFDNSMKDGGIVQLYTNTLRNLHFDHNSPGIPLRDYPNHFVCVYDLTSTQQSNSQVYYPELVGGALRLELTFEKALENSIEIFGLGEQLTTLYIKSSGEVYRDI